MHTSAKSVTHRDKHFDLITYFVMFTIHLIVIRFALSEK